jgi:DNA-binding GntR family transcriptional regulator
MNPETPIEILRPRMLYEALADAIRERIFRHELAPGEPLDEFSLAKTYVVSRTPIREALKVLASEGIVELQARRGCFVAHLSWDDVVKLFDLLELLEGFAVREAIKAGVPVSLDDELETPLAAASRNAYLPDLVDRLIAKLRLAFGPLFDHPDMQPSAKLRSDLAQAIRNGNIEEALHLLNANNAARRQSGKTYFSMAEASLDRCSKNGRAMPAPVPASELDTTCLVGEI